MNSAPSEYEIHAYVDGLLDDQRRQAVEFYLAQHPGRAKEVRGWQRDAQQLRAALSGTAMPAANPVLDPRRIRAGQRQRLARRLAVAAMLMVALGLGGFGGWQMRGRSNLAAEPPMADALQAYRLFASGRTVAFDVTDRRGGELQAWLERHFRGAPLLPNLQAAGFHPTGGRLLAVASGPAAMVVYQDDAGRAISFYIRPPASRGVLPRGQHREGDLVAEYGSDNGYNVAMVSHDDASDRQAARAALPSI